LNERYQTQLNNGEKSRTEYSAKNTTVAMFARVLAILLGFCTRVVFTHTLREEYVGINGLFTDILNVLALSELGIGTAITYALYKPIAEKDIEKQKSLMLLYKKFYRVVALVVLTGGLLVIPFMDKLIKNQAGVENLVLLYLMYLANSVISYLLIYKRTLIDAYQLSYIGVVYQTVFLIFQNLVQIIILLTTKNFTVFLSVLIICTLLNNLCISKKADKLYPFLKDKQVQPLGKEEKQGIYQNIRAMLMHKIGTVVVNNTDNLLLSSMVGIVSVGMYSNYYLVIGSIRQILNQAFQGITASVGNLGVEEGKERVQHVFEATFFIGQWMFGWATICLFELLTPFVDLSFGSQYVFGLDVTLVLCLNFYFTGMRQATLVFRDSLGVFWYDRHKSLAEALINLIFSVVLGYYYGVIGIFIGTLISTVTTSLWVEPYMLYKHRLQAPVRGYFFKYALYFLITGVAWWITDLLCRQIQGNVVTRLILSLLFCAVIPNVLFFIVYGRSKEYVFVVCKGKELLFRWMNGRKTSEPEREPGFSKEETMLFRMIKYSLCPEQCKKKKPAFSEEEWNGMIRLAEKHGMASLLCEELCEKQELPEMVQRKLNKHAEQIVLQQYRLLFLSKYVTNLLAENNISTVVLKGVTAGAYYPVPELRKSGDVDLLLMNFEHLESAKKILTGAGFQIREEQSALHHLCFYSAEGIDIELHTMLVEPFDNEKTNAGLQKLLTEVRNRVVKKEVMGVELPVLPDAYYGFELLLHMLQHFLRSGFGLRLLCDWVVFWQNPMDGQEREKYLEMTEQFGVRGFSDVVTQTCVKYLGLDEKLVRWMKIQSEYPTAAFMRETLDAEEFGKSNINRMVVLRGTGIFDYIREFHHQMQLNYPKAGRCILLWPLLWGSTLLRFLKNNRTLRKTSTKDILKETRQRSRLMKEIHLFR